MSIRYFVYRLVDASSGDALFQERLDIPEQSDHQTMNDDDARSMVADAAIRRMIRSGARPVHSLIQYCELAGSEHDALSATGDELHFDWDSCDPDELELRLGKEE